MIAILCSGAGLGFYTPGAVMRLQLEQAGIASELLVVESLYTTSKRAGFEGMKPLFQKSYAAAQIAHKTNRFGRETLDEDRLEALLDLWQGRGQRRFVVLSGFWVPVLREYAQRQQGVCADLCHLDAWPSTSWQMADTNMPGFRHIWFASWEQRKVGYTLALSDGDPVPFDRRRNRCLTHGGGWGIGTYLAKLPLMEKAGLALDVVVNDPSQADLSHPRNRYFMMAPEWRPGQAAPFPPMDRIGDSGFVRLASRAYPFTYGLMRESRALIAKPGAATLLETFASATPLVMLTPYGEYERKNKALWEHLGFGIDFEIWAGSGFDGALLEPLHHKLTAYRERVPDYMERLKNGEGFRTRTGFSPDDFEFLKQSIRIISSTRRGRKTDAGYAAPLPLEVGIQVTHHCNLRCRHCFQYADSGSFHGVEKQDLPLHLIRKILDQTRTARSRLYLWGGEPLMHRGWELICAMLGEERRRTVICTNGLLLDRYAEGLCRLGPKLTLLISLDGFEAEHDALRGKGAFSRVMENIRMLLALKTAGRFEGKVSLICVAGEANIGRLFSFVRFCGELGADALYLNLPWYIPRADREAMDRLFDTQFSWMGPRTPAPSWHSHGYRIPPGQIPALAAAVGKIRAMPWQMRVHLAPPLAADQIPAFCTGEGFDSPRQCTALSNRMEVDAFGRCGVCKFFPEFRMGDLESADMGEIWHNERFTRFRKALNRALMPVCSRCSLLYLNGRKIG